MKIALALSGGGIRALAHLGVIDVLRENGFEIAAISGSSGGALVGSLIADGKSSSEIRTIFSEVKRTDMMKGLSSKGGMFSLKQIEQTLDETLSSKRIETLPLPFIVAATDFAEGKIRYFDRGPVSTLCAASSSLTPFFAPVPYEDMLLADGGLMDNLPTKPLKKYGYPIIGINVNPIVKETGGNVFKMTFRALVLMMASNIEASRYFSDYYIEVAECEGINIFDFSLGDSAYEAGVTQAKVILTDLKETLNYS